ncbi:MAG: FIST N-terminal domain-containing protein [Cyanobium sp.]
MTAESWVKVGASKLLNTTEALDEALLALQGPQSPKLVVALVAPSFEMQAIAEGLHQALPGTEVIGCTTSGEIATDGAMANALVLWALGGDAIQVCTGSGQGDDLGLRKAATEAAHCLDQLEQRSNTVLMMLSDGLCGDQMDVVRGAYDVAGIDVPLVGGCAGDNLAMRRTRQMHGRRVMSQSVVAAAISSDRPLGIGVSHGWIPASEPMLVTSSKGNILSSLEDKPALDVYLNFFNPPKEAWTDPAAFADFAATHPIGIRRRDKIEMRHITGFNSETRDLITVAEVPQGALAFLTEGDFDSVLNAAAKSCQSALAGLNGADPVGLFLFDCVSRRAVFTEDRVHEETDLIASSCGRIPMAGFYTYGEICRTKGAGGFHNQTLVTLAIG